MNPYLSLTGFGSEENKFVIKISNFRVWFGWFGFEHFCPAQDLISAIRHITGSTKINLYSRNVHQTDPNHRIFLRVPIRIQPHIWNEYYDLLWSKHAPPQKNPAIFNTCTCKKVFQLHVYNIIFYVIWSGWSNWSGGSKWSVWSNWSGWSNWSIWSYWSGWSIWSIWSYWSGWSNWSRWSYRSGWSYWSGNK